MSDRTPLPTDVVEAARAVVRWWDNEGPFGTTPGVPPLSTPLSIFELRAALAGTDAPIPYSVIYERAGLAGATAHGRR